MEREQFLRKLTVERLEQLCQSLGMQSQVDFTALRSALTKGDIADAEAIFRRLMTDHELLYGLTHARALASDTLPNQPTFLVSSELLYDGYEQLRQYENEIILYATGTAFNDLLTIERTVDIEHDRSEYGRATSNAAATSRTLAQLEKRGSLLTAYLHMHPGRGKSSNLPSQIDLTNQMQLETAGYRTVGIIYSRDGYARFFSHRMPFHVCVTGKGVRHAAEKLYRLTEV